MLKKIIALTVMEQAAPKEEIKTINLSDRIKGTIFFKREIIQSIKDNEKLNIEAIAILLVVCFSTIFAEGFYVLYTFFFGDSNSDNSLISLLQQLIWIPTYHLGGGIVFFGFIIFMGNLITRERLIEKDMVTLRTLSYAYFPNMFKMIVPILGFWLLEILINLWWVAATIFALMIVLEKDLKVSMIVVIVSLTLWVLFIQLMGIVIFGS